MNPGRYLMAVAIVIYGVQRFFYWVGPIRNTQLLEVGSGDGSPSFVHFIYANKNT
jgi:hypothetical protein